MNHINNNNNNTTEMKGGFRYKSKPKDKKHMSFDKLVKETKKSEGKLISSYEEMDKKSQDYAKSYKDHIENLEVLDDYAHFNGLTTLFQQVIMKDNIKTGKIDTSIPIFFRNYMIEGEVSPNVLREEHLKRQIDYLTDKRGERNGVGSGGAKVEKINTNTRRNRSHSQQINCGRYTPCPNLFDPTDEIKNFHAKRLYFHI